MKTFKTFIREDKVPDHIGWYPIRQIQDLTIGQRIRSPDGLGEIFEIITSKFDKIESKSESFIPFIQMWTGKNLSIWFWWIDYVGQKLPRKEVKDLESGTDRIEKKKEWCDNSSYNLMMIIIKI